MVLVRLMRMMVLVMVLFECVDNVFVVNYVLWVGKMVGNCVIMILFIVIW